MSRKRGRSIAADEVPLPVPVAERPVADQMTDVVVVGSDPGALAAAIACRQAGWEVLVVEPGPQLGSDAALGTGQLWLPGNPGVPDDDYAASRDYFDRVVGDPDAATSAPRRHAFLTGTGPLAEWLSTLGVGLRPDQVGDHHPEVPGGRESGRVLVPLPVDATEIGRLAERLPDGAPTAAEGLVDKLEHSARQAGGLARGHRMVHGGAALTSQLLAVCQRLQVNIWWDAPVHRPVTASEPDAPERVLGVIVQRGHRPVRVLAGRGVVLAQGGFGADARLRREYLPQPSRPGWSLGAARDDGAKLLDWAGELGLQVGGLGNAWWRPALWHPEGQVWDASTALAAPNGFVVDASGRRFANEAASGNDFCRALYARARELGPETIPVWLVVDAEHRRRVGLGPLPAGRTPRSALRDGLVVSARTLPELAWAIKVDAAGLQATAERFDEFARAGVDADFGRGATAAERARGDRTQRPNPVLGSVMKAPFYAIRVVPGDLGTKGGLLTDEQQRVLAADGPLAGLWAIGAAAASVTGAADPAPGVGLAEAMVAGRAAAASLTLAE